jgi:hypothetical protein
MSDERRASIKNRILNMSDESDMVDDADLDVVEHYVSACEQGIKSVKRKPTTLAVRILPLLKGIEADTKTLANETRWPAMTAEASETHQHAAGLRLLLERGKVKPPELLVQLAVLANMAGCVYARAMPGCQGQPTPALRAQLERQYSWLVPAVAAEVYTAEKRTLAAGDRLQFRRPDNRRNIANSEFATVLSISPQKARIKFQAGQEREMTLPADALRHVDYGYTVTSFSSQGSTVDKVIVNDDSMRGSKLVNREQEYVSVSRAKIDARIYTDDAQALRRAVSRDPKKEIALEAIQQQTPRQQQQPSMSIGI